MLGGTPPESGDPFQGRGSTRNPVGWAAPRERRLVPGKVNRLKRTNRTRSGLSQPVCEGEEVLVEGVPGSGQRVRLDGTPGTLGPAALHEMGALQSS